MAQCIPVIMSGGAGTRLWPASRGDRPKQFLPLVTERSMFAETLARVPVGPLYAAPVIIGNASHDALIRAALDSAGVAAQHILLEPEARNTAAAICLAALQIGEKDMGAVMLVLPSDHVVGDTTAFEAATQTAGLWHDVYDLDGQMQFVQVPATTLYHLWGGLMPVNEELASLCQTCQTQN